MGAFLMWAVTGVILLVVFVSICWLYDWFGLFRSVAILERADPGEKIRITGQWGWRFVKGFSPYWGVFVPLWNKTNGLFVVENIGTGEVSVSAVPQPDSSEPTFLKLKEGERIEVAIKAGKRGVVFVM